MKNFESIEQPVNNFINPEGAKLDITNAAQMELMELMGSANDPVVWINANAARFRQLIDDPDRDLIERLANEHTHAEAITEIKNNLYH